MAQNIHALIKAGTAPATHACCSCLEQFRGQCFSQGHFDTQTGVARVKPLEDDMTYCTCWATATSCRRCWENRKKEYGHKCYFNEQIIDRYTNILIL